MNRTHFIERARRIIGDAPALPLILIDIDGVLSDTSAAQCVVIEREFGIRCEPAQITTWHYHECLPITTEQESRLWNEHFPEVCAAAAPLPGADEGLRLLQDNAFAWICAVTNRRSELGPVTASWLMRHGLELDDLIHHEGCKTALCKRETIGLVIEDKGEAALAFAEKGVPVLLFDYPYNRAYDHANIMRVVGWPGALPILEEILR